MTYQIIWAGPSDNPLGTAIVLFFLLGSTLSHCNNLQPILRKLIIHNPQKLMAGQGSSDQERPVAVPPSRACALKQETVPKVTVTE